MTGAMRRAKIVCTIGPASCEPAMLDRLIEAGMNVARLNFSHGTQAGHAVTLEAVRAAADRRRTASEYPGPSTRSPEGRGACRLRPPTPKEVHHDRDR